jgi:hypothetical protein
MGEYTSVPVDTDEYLVAAWALITGAGDPDDGVRGWIRDNLALEVEALVNRRPDLRELLDPAPEGLMHPVALVRWGDVREGAEVLYDGTVHQVDGTKPEAPGDERRVSVLLSGRWHCLKRDDLTAVLTG